MIKSLSIDVCMLIKISLTAMLKLVNWYDNNIKMIYIIGEDGNQWGRDLMIPMRKISGWLLSLPAYCDCFSV